MKSVTMERTFDRISHAKYCIARAKVLNCHCMLLTLLLLHTSSVNVKQLKGDLIVVSYLQIKISSLDNKVKCLLLVESLSH